ncbi:MAG: response regulator [Hellea sp.]|nr:response regulator [Hellea sp.]
MTSDDQQLFKPNAEFDLQIQQRAPEWLQKIGSVFGLGMAMFGPKNQIVFHNGHLLKHCALPDQIITGSKNIGDWLNFMAQRGDFKIQSGETNVQGVLDRFREVDDQEAIFDNITPANGRILKFSAVKSSGGIITLFSEDVTEIRRNQESLDMALEMGESGYFNYMFNSNEMTISSKYLENILTADEFELLRQKGFWPFFVPDDAAKAEHEWKNAVEQRKPLSLILRIRTQMHGTRWLNFNIRPLYNQSGSFSHLIGFFEDITDDLTSRNEIELAKEQTEEALKSKTHFLARISHEIRTPMNAVIGIADALIHHNKSPAIVPKLELIQNSAGSILNILDDTLNHSKLDTDQFTVDPKLENIGKTVEQICELWESKAKANNTKILCHVDESVPDELFVDRYRYEQCLNNLLSNAIKFSPGGTINVICTRVDRNGAPSLLLAVKDTGIGMTDDQRSRIFEAYQQGDESISRRFGGTGLGMNITKNLIERMGGTISVKSEIGKGSVFVLSLPIRLKSEESDVTSDTLFDQIMDSAEDVKDTPYSRLKILVADDNPTNHMVVKSLLDTVVAEIYTANHGQDVLDILDVQDIDIILMDIHMPVMDGIEATLAIRSSPKSWSDVLIVAVTADPQYQQQRLCLNIGMDFAVAKPIKLADILEAIDKVLANRNARIPMAKSA